MPIFEGVFNLFLAFNAAFATILLGILTAFFVCYTVSALGDRQVAIVKRAGIFAFLVFLTSCFASFTYYAGTRTLLFYNEASLGLTVLH